MVRAKRTPPRWIANLRFLMKARDINARALSLKAGLNPTAVRDMLEGRTQSPRYDTVEALSAALAVTPAQLMGGSLDELKKDNNAETDDDLALLTEIIARLQELAEDRQHKLRPQDFAAMVTTIYRQMTATTAAEKTSSDDVLPRLHDLIAYEALRKRLIK